MADKPKEETPKVEDKSKTRAEGIKRRAEKRKARAKAQKA